MPFAYMYKECPLEPIDVTTVLTGALLTRRQDGFPVLADTLSVQILIIKSTESGYPKGLPFS